MANICLQSSYWRSCYLRHKWNSEFCQNTKSDRQAAPLGILFLSLLKHNQFLNCNPNSQPPCWQVIRRPVTFHHNGSWHSRPVPERKWFSLTPRPTQIGRHFADDIFKYIFCMKIVAFQSLGISWNLQLVELFWNHQTVASFTKEVNPRLAKRPLISNGRLANRGLTSLVKEVTGSRRNIV